MTLDFKRSKTAEGMHYIRQMKREEFGQQLALIQTVKEQQSQFSKREVAQAGKAREQMIKFNYISPMAHKDLIQNGYLSNNDVSIDDLSRSMQIWGKPVERLRGNAKYAKPCSASDGLKDFELEPELRHNIAHLDLFFIRGVSFIVAVLDPMKYCWVEHLPNKNADSIRVSLERFLAEMKSRRVRVSMVRCDNEGGVWA